MLEKEHTSSLVARGDLILTKRDLSKGNNNLESICSLKQQLCSFSGIADWFMVLKCQREGRLSVMIGN